MKRKDVEENSASTASRRVSQEKPAANSAQSPELVSQPVAPPSSAFTPTSTPTPTPTPVPESSSNVPALAMSDILASSHSNNDTIATGTLENAHAGPSSAPPSPTTSQQIIVEDLQSLPINNINNTDQRPDTLESMPNGQVKSSQVDTQ